MQRLALVVVSLVVIVGCHQDNPESCELPGNAGIAPCPPDAAPPDPSCKNDDGCALSPDFPVCKITDGVGSCVQCTTDKHDTCRGMTPICGTDNRCTGCKNHAECGSNVCKPDGSCAMESEVAYVDGDTGTDQPTCSRMLPCTQIEKAVMAKTIVKIAGTVKQSARLDKSVTLLGEPGAAIVLPSTDNGAALEIRGNANVTIKIYDLQIRGSANVNPTQGALTLSEMANLELTRVTLRDNMGNAAAVTGGHLTCDQCTVANNALRGFDVSGGRITVTRSSIIDNKSSGFNVQSKGDFEIVGNIIFRNGDMGSLAAGGINIVADAQGPNDPPNLLEFNTLSANVAANTAGQAIQCNVVTPMVARNNIVWDNGLDPVTAIQVAFNANCTYAFSDIGPIGIGTTNSNMNEYPQFQDAPPVGKLLHLMPTSTVRGRADPSSDLNGLARLDFDGEPRVSRGAGMGADMGADQTP